jgi:hypothetical protein
VTAKPTVSALRFPTSLDDRIRTPRRQRVGKTQEQRDIKRRLAVLECARESDNVVRPHDRGRPVAFEEFGEDGERHARELVEW